VISGAEKFFAGENCEYNAKKPLRNVVL